MRSLIVQPDAVQGDRIHITDKDDIAYLSVVLRMNEGDELVVSDGEGRVYGTIIGRISKGMIELSVVEEKQVSDEGRTRVTLYQGLPKGAKMEEIVRKATELGVYRVVPVATARAIPGQNDVSASRRERWQRIAKEASRQSRRIRVPAVDRVFGFEEAAAGLAEEQYDLILVLYELEETETLKQALRERGVGPAKEKGKPAEIAVFIGPEGGFESFEVERLALEGGRSVTIGETILRTETAGPAAIAMILYELDM